jgi:sulfate adenylyltransferase subunit 2
MESYRVSALKNLEAESIHIIREVFAEFEKPVMLYSVGKDSSVMVRLAQKAFSPGTIPIPLLHVDTSLKFPEMIEFRDRFCKEIGADLHIYRNEDAIGMGTNPATQGTVRCCDLLKTQALLASLREGGYDAAFGGARRDEERSRAKERVFSFRDEFGQWDPKNQRPEIWRLYNPKHNPGESIRVFPLSNWTELDVWEYIKQEDIPIVPMYYAKERQMIEKNGQLIPAGPDDDSHAVMCRFRTLGCYPCTGAVRSTATSLDEIIEEMKEFRQSERSTRLIDHDQDASMEQKKREGYF